MEPHEFWQVLYPPGSLDTAGPHRAGFPASLPDGRQILLPIRPIEGGARALASLIVNQASFAVVEALAHALADRLRPARPQIVVGLPTLGLTLAAETARALGHTRYVPLGTSRKFWYEERLSVPMSSITSPDQEKRLYLDPRVLPLLAGARVALIDDVISTGSSMAAGLVLLRAAGVSPVALGTAMLQSERWRQPLTTVDPGCVELVATVFSTPILQPVQGGWAEG